MNTLVVDVGGARVKILADGQKQPRRYAFPPALTARQMVSEVQRLAGNWRYDVVSIGYPGPVLRGCPLAEPQHLAHGCVGFDFEQAFHWPSKLENDAAIKTSGSDEGGERLFLGLGPGLGSTLIMDGIAEPMELGHHSHRKGIYEEYLRARGLAKYRRRKWQRYVADVVGRLTAALEPDEVVLGGGNAKAFMNIASLRRAPFGRSILSTNGASS
jgi:polyphosphate glucokinase